MTCIYIARERNAKRHSPTWKWVGIGLCISAFRDWICTIGVSYGTLTFYFSATFLLALAALCFLCAARLALAAADIKPGFGMHALTGALGIMVVLQAIHCGTGWEWHQATQVFLTKAFFFLATVILVRSCGHGADPMPKSHRHALIVLSLYAFTLIITLPPGMSELPVDVGWNMLNAGLYWLRILLGFTMVALMWNLYGRMVGVRGWIRLWPLVVINLLVIAGFVFVGLASRNYSSLLAGEILNAARNAAAVIPADKVRAATAREPGAADEALRTVRQLSFAMGRGKIRPRIDVLVAESGSFTGRLLDSNSLPGTGIPVPSAAGLTGLTNLSAPDFLYYYTPDMRNPIAAAPVIDSAGITVGTVLVTISAIDLVRDFYAFKRPLLIIMPVVFLVFLLLVRGQQRAWLASHSTNWEEALKTGALATDLAGVFITCNHRILDVNRRACEMLDVVPDQLVGKSMDEALQPVSELDKQLGRQIRLALRQDGKAYYETEVRSLSGRRMHTMVFARILAQEAEGSTIIWEMVDISRLKGMESQVRESRDYLQMVIDTVPVVMFVKDMDGRYTMANNLFAQLVGLKNAQSAIGTTAACISDKMFESAIVNDAKCVELNGTPHVYEQEFIIDGKPTYLEISKTLKWMGDDKEKYVIVGSIHDFTTRKQIENAVRSERHFLMQLLNTMPVIVCFIDPDRIIRVCNTAFAREAGVDDPSLLIGKPYDEVAPFGPVDVEDEEKMLEIGHGNSDVNIDLCWRGTARQFVLRRIALSSENGEVLGLLKAFWETTDLVKANRAALAAARVKNAFLANMSHELRTPMNGIIGMTSLLVEQATPEQRLSTDIINKSAKTLQMVVDEVMDIATMETDARQLSMHVESFELLPAMEETVRIESTIIEAWGVDLLFKYDFRLPLAYYGDALRLRQIVVQIISHCSRISPNSTVKFMVGEGNNSMLSLAVRFKPGDGSNAASLEALFLASAEVGSNTVRIEQLGMLNARVGLPLTWRLIQAMRGVLQVTEEEDGVVCEVLLPLKPDPKAAGQAVAPDLTGRRVMIAADAARADAAEAILSHAGALPETVDQPSLIVDKAMKANVQENPYHLILLDAKFILPCQVVEILQRLANGDAGAPSIVVMTRNQDVESVLAVYHRRVDSYITYPLCPSDVWEKAEVAGDPNRRRHKATTRRGQTRVIVAPEEPFTAPPPAADASIAAKVLLVEDNTVNQMVQLGILKRLGCTIELAKNGQEAVDKISNGEEYDIIFMDCMMPVMDGYEATTRIRIHERSTPGSRRHTIIALTANSVSGDREKCLASGMDDYLAKPVTLDAIRAMLAKHCETLIPADDSGKKSNN